MTLTDCKPKFGSVVNGKKLSANEKVELFPSSELRFGQGNATGTFRYTCIYNQEYVIKERREYQTCPCSALNVCGESRTWNANYLKNKL